MRGGIAEDCEYRRMGFRKLSRKASTIVRTAGPERPKTAIAARPRARGDGEDRVVVHRVYCRYWNSPRRDNEPVSPLAILQALVWERGIYLAKILTSEMSAPRITTV